MNRLVKAWRLPVVLGWACACGTSPQKPNLLLVTWDTTRADVVHGETAPGIELLSKEGVRFLNARSTVPLTLPAHTSLLSGKYPHETGTRLNGAHTVAPEVFSLAEAFQDAGYLTAAFVSSAVLDSDYGLDQGFSLYDDRMPTDSIGQYYAERAGELTVLAATEWLQSQEGDEPLFLWVHLFDPHRPWEPSAQGTEVLPFPYEAEVWDTDRVTTALLQSMDQAGRLSNSLFVLTSDHGESLGEHGEWTHGIHVYDSTMHIPLLFWAGEESGFTLAGGHQPTDRVSLVDVAPTVASMFGLDFETSGVDLSPALQGRPLGVTRDLLMETGYPPQRYNAAPVFGVVREDGDVWIDSPWPERYEMDSDPKQLENLFDAEVHGATLESLRATYPRDPDSLQVSQTLSAEKIIQLRALGYVAGGEVGEATDDVKERREMVGLIQSGALGVPPRDALKMLDAWEGEWGPLAPLDEMRIYLLDYLGRPEEADAWFVAHQDTVETARRDLEARLADRAEKRALIPAMEEALRRNPLHPTARADLALTLWKVGRPDDARAYFDQAVVQEPGNAQLRSDAVRFWISQDDPGKAFSLLQDAQEEDGQLHGELLCLRARVRGMLGEAEARVDDLRACRREGGELGPTEWPLVQED